MHYKINSYIRPNYFALFFPPFFLVAPLRAAGFLVFVALALLAGFFTVFRFLIAFEAVDLPGVFLLETFFLGAAGENR